MQTINNIYLFTTSRNIKYATYIVGLEVIKASAGRGVLLRWLQNIAKATPPTRNRKENKKLTTPVRCE
jgi:outer membrane protein assembly factor BamD (BamD/ComL family)